MFTMPSRCRLAPLAAAISLAVGASTVRAQESATAGDTALARHVSAARVALARGLSAAAARGKPISGKYEIDNGKLQLSIYTEQGGHFQEVIVNHATGRIAKAEEIKEGEDLDAAKSQSAVMSAAKRSLEAAVTRAVRANRGYRAVSVMPTRSAGRPVAEVRLVRGRTFKSVSEPLD